MPTETLLDQTKVTREVIDRAFRDLRRLTAGIDKADHDIIRQAIGEAEALADDMKRWLPADVVPLKPRGDV